MTVWTDQTKLNCLWCMRVWHV